MSFLQIGLRGRHRRTLQGPNLKKKRKENEIADEGEVVCQKEPKQQKTAKGQVKASLI